MALALYDRVQQTGTANTTVSFTLSGSVTGYQSFSVVGNGNTTYYGATDTSGNWEVGIGTYATGGTLTRTTILASSNSGSAVTFSGTVTVFVTYPSERSVNLDDNGVATIGTTLSYSDTGIIGSFASTVAGYNQVVIQNKSSAANASSNLNVSNDASTSTSGYAELGINSSAFTGTGSFNIAGASYLASASTDLTIGTYGAYNVHFVTNSNTTDAMTIFNSGGVSLGGQPDPGIGTLYANNVYLGFNSITAAAGTTVLTNASAGYQNVVGTTTQTIQLPVATTLYKGLAFTVANASTGNVTIKDSASTTLDTIVTGGTAILVLTNNGTSAGTWVAYSYLPASYDFSTSTANFGGATLTNGLWNGTTIATGYGGTGLTTFTAANNALYSTSSSALTAGTLPVAAGGTGNTTNTLNGVVYGNGTSALGVTAAGTTGQVLIATTSGAPSWGSVPTTAAVTSFQTSLSGLTPSSATTGVVTLAGTLGVASGGTGATTLTGYVKGSGTSALTAASTIPTSDLTGTLGIGNGGTGQTTAAAAYNALTPLTTTGDLVYEASASTAARLPIGTSGQVLTVAGGIPSWQAAGGSTTLTTTDFTATSGQTSFTVTYTPALLQGVYRNGIKLGQADYTATSGTAIVLATGAITGDLIQVQYFSSLATTTAVNSISFGSTGLTPSTATAGAVTVAGTLAVANGGTGVTTSTGSGNVVLSTSPTLVTPLLGTPTSGTLTNCTGYTTANLSGTITNAQLANSSVTVTAGTGMSGGGAVALGSSVTLTNAGVTSAVAGTGISVSGATGAVTITNSGVTSIVAGTGISVSGATGAVTVSSTASGATITGTTTSATYYVVGTTLTSGTLSTASISNTNAVSYNANTGALTAVSMVSSSDERLKTNWAGLDTDFVSRLANVKHGTFERISSGNREVGVTAQSLKDVLPEAVIESNEGLLGVNYGGAALVAAIELAKEVKELRAEIKALKAELNK
jgi:hypothetical protein